MPPNGGVAIVVNPPPMKYSRGGLPSAEGTVTPSAARASVMAKVIARPSARNPCQQTMRAKVVEARQIVAG
jgi:hypothetical protein